MVVFLSQCCKSDVLCLLSHLILLLIHCWAQCPQPEGQNFNLSPEGFTVECVAIVFSTEEGALHCPVAYSVTTCNIFYTIVTLKIFHI